MIKYQYRIPCHHNKYYYTSFCYIHYISILLGGGDIADELRKDNQSLRQRIEQLESELDGKNNEIKQMKTSDVVQTLQKENQELQSTAKLAQSELDIALSAHESQKQVLLTLNQQLVSRIQELATIHDEITTALQT
ncbi:sprouty-related evh1 domain-containing protein family member [Holotrichia oblita]|uniref:Sprouty-related evh1 domain-containing protein family member n=1 Tax=Holotrichia oblita TaxID=644536 RepID=A0ACB9TNH9_HOLOL|nr:sprouty-related evh1 domain-containing protein family member [Holotrichia oblita]